MVAKTVEFPPTASFGEIYKFPQRISDSVSNKPVNLNLEISQIVELKNVLSDDLVECLVEIFNYYSKHLPLEKFVIDFNLQLKALINKIVDESLDSQEEIYIVIFNIAYFFHLQWCQFLEDQGQNSRGERQVFNAEDITNLGIAIRALFWE